MQVSSHTNAQQALNSYQQPKQNLVTLPVEPKDPTYSPSEIYEASNGNVISDRSGDVSLTPQGEVNVTNALNDAKTVAEEEQQAKDDALRGVAVDYVGAQSKQAQAEIYLSVATDGDVDLESSTPSVIETLRDVQKQNDSVEAYAKYQENQEGGLAKFS